MPAHLGTILTIAATSAVFIAILLYAIIKLGRIRSGEDGRKKIKRVLRKMLKTCDGRLYSDVTLEHGGKNQHFDLFCVGSFGVILVESFCLDGELYGSGNSDKLTFIIKKQKRTIPNFLSDLSAQTAFLRGLFKDGEVYNVRNIESHAVFPSKGTQVFLSDMPVAAQNLKSFSAQMMKVSKMPEQKIDIELLYRVTESAIVRG